MLKLIKSAIVDKATLVMYIVLFLAAVFFDFSPVLSVIVAGVLGNLLAAQGAALMESLFGSFLTVSGSYTGAAASAAATVAGVAIIGGADGPTAVFVTTRITAQEIWGLCVKVFSNVVVVVLNYVFSKLIIFKKK